MPKHAWQHFLNETRRLSKVRLIERTQVFLGEFLTGYLVGMAGNNVYQMTQHITHHEDHRDRLILALTTARFLKQFMPREQVKQWMTSPRADLGDYSICDLLRDGYDDKVIDYVESRPEFSALLA